MKYTNKVTEKFAFPYESKGVKQVATNIYG